MQKIKIGHRANFRAKYKCSRQILFPVRAILRSINFRYADFNTDLADACILVMACVDCARACSLKTLSSLLKLSFKAHARAYEAVLVSRSFAPGFVDMILGRAIQHKRGLFRWVGDDLFLLQSRDSALGC